MSDDLPIDLTEALQKAQYNEFVRMSVVDENGNNRDILLFACLDEENGGIQWRNLTTNVDPTVQFFRTKRWVFPMLNDVNRNEMYQKAIRCAVEKLRDRAHSSNQSSEHTWSVLDIGSGTGFLGMLAAKAFKESLSEDKVTVVSIEMAEEMATVARRTVRDNQLSDVISVMEGHSCELPPLSLKADLCVSELLESGLLGEGILPALRDAWERHLRDDALMIPQRARVFAQLVGCEKDEANWMEIFYGPHNQKIAKSFGDEDNDIQPLRWSLDPDGQSLLLDARQVQIPIHAKRLFEKKKFISLSEVVPVFAFDFTTRDACMAGIEGRRHLTTASATTQGTICGVLLWWELDLWDDITYSCEPGRQNFQDHWQQCLQILPSGDCIHVEPKDTISLEFSHNDERVFVDSVGKGSKVEPETKRLRKNGSDTALISHFRAYQLNDSSRLESFRSALVYSLSMHANGKAARMLDISDGGWGAWLAGALGATNVISVESSSDDRAMIAARIAQCGNGFPLNIDGETATFDIIVSHLENLSVENLGGQSPDIVIADYYHIFEGWHLQESLNYFYKCRLLRQRGIISDKTIILPCSFRVMACAIESEELRSAYSSCGDEDGSILGLDHSYLNKVAGDFSAYDLSLPLFWQYDYKELTDIFEIHSFKMGCITSHDAVRNRKKINFKRTGSVDAVVFWIEYDFPKSGLSFSSKKEPYNQLVRMMPIPRHNLGETDLKETVMWIEFLCGGLAPPSTHELTVSIETGHSLL